MTLFPTWYKCYTLWLRVYNCYTDTLFYNVENSDMTRKVGGKKPIRKVSDSPETNLLYHLYSAPMEYAKERKSDRWKAAQATASERLPLNGRSRVFKIPG